STATARPGPSTCSGTANWRRFVICTGRRSSYRKRVNMSASSSMQGFAGFPDGKQRVTTVPNLFFSDLLPAIHGVAELWVTLSAFWALRLRERDVRYLPLSDFMNLPIRLKAMGESNIQSGVDALLDGIERAVARGPFLQVTVEGSDGQMELYFL